MKIIKLDEKNNPYAFEMYYRLDNIFFFAAEYLPWIFLKKVYLNGEMYQLPRLITKRHMESINKKTQKLMNKLNYGNIRSKKKKTDCTINCNSK